MGCVSSSESSNLSYCVAAGCRNYGDSKLGNLCQTCYLKQMNTKQPVQPTALPVQQQIASTSGLQIKCPMCCVVFNSPNAPSIQCPSCRTVLQVVSNLFTTPSTAQPTYSNSSLGNPPPYSLPFQFSGKQEKEPMLLLDTTGSMLFSNKEDDNIMRREIVYEALSCLVGHLEEHDSQAEHEEKGGGLRTITFAGGKACDLEDINSNNLRETWEKIRWGGDTLIMPGWKLLLDVYNEEFGNRSAETAPILMALIITDGEAEDLQTFINALDSTPQAYITIALLGYGKEHMKALHGFQQLYQRHSHRVRLIPFESETDPTRIASAMIKMVE